MDFSIELAVSFAAVFAAAVGSALSWSLENISGLADLWAKVQKKWKPLVLFAFFAVLAPMPIGLDAIGLPDYLLNAVLWLPSTSPTWGNFLFAEVIAVVAYATSQAFFLNKILNGNRD